MGRQKEFSSIPVDQFRQRLGEPILWGPRCLFFGFHCVATRLGSELTLWYIAGRHEFKGENKRKTLEVRHKAQAKVSAAEHGYLWVR